MAKMTTDSSSELRVHYAQRCDILHDEVASKHHILWRLERRGALTPNIL